jgi:hypothetical protein
MKLPRPRGPVSASLVSALRRPPHDLPTQLAAALPDRESITSEDLQLTLFLCYELHYRGFDGVDERWEWNPSLLRLRATAEDTVERDLRRLVEPLPARCPDAD